MSTATVLILAALVLIGTYLWHTYGRVIDLMWPRHDLDDDTCSCHRCTCTGCAVCPEPEEGHHD